MSAKAKGRVAPQIDFDLLIDNFAEQLESGQASDATASGIALPLLQSLRGQAVRIDHCWLNAVTLSEPGARGLQLHDVRVEESDLANVVLTGGSIERVEMVSTRLTGAIFTEARLKNVLFRECKMDFALMRMARLKQCEFERCNLTDADFYGADLSGTVFRDCDLSRADLSHAKLGQADIRGCRLDGLRGTPETMSGLVISPDQAALLITLYGVRVEW